MPKGRPTKYSPARCKEVYETLADGASVTEYAAQIGVSRQTIYEWAEVHQEFSDALTRAKEAGQAYWERRLRTDLMVNKDANAPLVKLYFANRFRWHDKSEHDHRSQDGSMTPQPTTVLVCAPDDGDGSDSGAH